MNHHQSDCTGGNELGLGDKLARLCAVVFVGIAVALPAISFADADFPSQINWGNVVYDDEWNVISDDQIAIQDGGTYAVPLHIAKSVGIQNMRYEPLHGNLYLVSNVLPKLRTMIGTYGGYSGLHTLSWNQAGHYEMDIYKEPAPVLGSSLLQKVKDFIIGSTVYAQTDSDFLETIAFDITDESAPTGESNVLFIPGTESSRLYQNTGSGETQLWEPKAFSNQPGVQKLDLRSDGTSITPTYTKANGALDTVGFVVARVPVSVQDVYKTFLQQLAQLKTNNTISDYLVFPYDWRMSPEDVVDKGTLYDDGVHYLDTELVSLAATSKTGKVTIVAHSNGGLVTKVLMNKLVQEGKANLVDKIIFVAVPQDGTPAAISVILHGDQTGIPSFVVSQTAARGLVQYMPDAYDLLPAAAYFARVAAPVVDLTNAPLLRSTAGFSSNTITSVGNLNKFLTGSGGRAKPVLSNVEIPNVLSVPLLASSTALHSSLDVWEPPVGVQVIQIAGWGIDTPTGVVYTESSKQTCAFALTCSTATITRHTVNFTEDGDGTVVTPSAVATSSWPTYYVNIQAYNSDTHKRFEHSDITETQPFQGLFNLLLSSSSPQTLPTYVTETKPDSSSSGKSLRLRVLSPVSLDAYDTAGNHTGIAPNQDPQADVLVVQNDIPGSYYRQYGEGQYIGLPADANYHVVLDGQSTGTFTFEVTPVNNGVVGTPISFADIPVTASSTATIGLVGSNPASTTIALDVNGDGITDITIASSSQTTDTLSYAKLIKSGIAGMDIGNPVQRQLQAKLANVIYLLNKIDQWDQEDDDERDTDKNDKVAVRVVRKLKKIETYITNELGRQNTKCANDERITSEQATAILGMIEQLAVLVNTK